MFGEGQAEQVVEDAGQPLALGLHRRDLLVAVGQFEREEFDPQQQGGQRIAQLVRGVGDEGPLLLEHVLDVVGHLVERPGQPAQFGRAHGRRHPGLQPAGGHVVRRRVQDPHRAQHPAGEPDRGAHRDQHGSQFARCEQQPAVQDPGAQLAGRRVGDHHGDHVPVTDHGRGDGESPPLPGQDLRGVVAAPAGECLAECLVALAAARDVPPPGSPGHGRAVPVEDAGADAVEVVVALEFGPQGDQPAALALPVGGRGAGGDVLGERGEARGVVDPVDDEPLLVGRRHAAGERETEGEEHTGHEDDEQGKQSGAHVEPSGALSRPVRRAGSRPRARSR